MIRIKVKQLLFVFFCCCLQVQAQSQFWNIVDFGAKPDTQYLSTAAINKAVIACAGAGGGRVIVPAGRFRSGTITLLNNVELFLAPGSFLYASTALADFPRQKQPAYQSLKDKGGWFSLVYAEGAHNIAIRGSGTIDGNGARQLPHPDLFGGDLDGRPRNILFISCKGVTVEGITLLNSGMWNQHYLDCEDGLISNIKVYNHSNRNNDGIDIDGCRRFTLSNSIIDSDDDGICLKSTGLAPCENIVVTGCIVSSHTNAIKCGTESSGGFRNIVISSCIVKPSQNTEPTIFRTPHAGYTGVSLEITDGGIMEGVSVDNILIEETECPIYVRLGNRARKHIETAATPPPGKMKNISISNITAYNAGNYSSSITGVPGAIIEDISLSNIRLHTRGGLKEGTYITSASLVKEMETSYPQPNNWGNLPSYGLFIRHVKEVNISRLSLSTIGAEQRIPLIAVDVQDLIIRDLHIQHRVPGVEDLQMTGVTNHQLDATIQFSGQVKK
jgi:polygalacturonase